jgi:iron complex transport system ATP-binding protein
MTSDQASALEATELTVQYPSTDKAALNRVSMIVPSGAFYAVLGPNGSGKSTLLRALLGMVPSVGGETRVSGRAVSDWKRRDLAREVGVVAQAESLAFPLTVRDLVGMGRYPYLKPLQSETSTDRAAVKRAMERCDVWELGHRFVSTLSGGELQRARVARALAQEPRVLVLDEPTASLDIRHEMEILELLRSSADGGMTIFLITHHLDHAARFADRVLLLDRGSVAAEGAPREVLRESTLQEVYQWPVSVDDDPDTGILRVTPQSGSYRSLGSASSNRVR